jgi:mannose-6-phosphate isomerase
MTIPLYPLRFQPLFKRYLWGGRRLGTVLGKPIGEGSDYAESWEVVDHGADQSIVANGALAGMTLGRLVKERGEELLGGHAERHGGTQRHGGRSLQRTFPLLFKYLDCQRDLSVQVHPDDAAAAKLDPPDLGKTEAWVILDALPGSRVYAGLAAGVSKAELARAVERGQTERCLHWFEARPGDCVFIPAGTVHALGAGLLVAEIQQASDTTYRLFDWNRVGPDGKPRTLHVREALAAIDESAREVQPIQPQVADRPGVERLVSCDKFVLDRWRIEGATKLDGDDRFHILSVLAGEVAVGSPDEIARRGQTVLVPASAAHVKLSPRGKCEVLDSYLP